MADQGAPRTGPLRVLLLGLLAGAAVAQDLPPVPPAVLGAPRSLSPRGLRMLAALEGCYVRNGLHRLYGGRQPHVGYGHRVRPGEEAGFREGLSEEKALGLLRADVSRAEAEARALVPTDLPPHAFDAFVMLTFNVGLERLQGSRLVACLAAGDLRGAASRWLDFTKVVDPATGQRVESPSLVRRRKEEQYLLRTGRYLDLPPRNGAAGGLRNG